MVQFKERPSGCPSRASNTFWPFCYGPEMCKLLTTGKKLRDRKSMGSVRADAVRSQPRVSPCSYRLTRAPKSNPEHSPGTVAAATVCVYLWHGASQQSVLRAGKVALTQRYYGSPYSPSEQPGRMHHTPAGKEGQMPQCHTSGKILSWPAGRHQNWV